MLRRGSGTTSKSLGDLPEFREDNWIQKSDAADEDHWTGLPAPRSASSSSKNRDLFEDNEPLPEPEYRSSSKGFSLPLFGGKKSGSLVNDGEKLSPSKYDAFREGPERSLSLEEALEETAFSDPTIKKRERSKSLGGRLKSAFSAFSSKYEALTRPGDPTIPGLEDAPIRGEDETTFKGVHFSKDERGSKIHEEHIVTAIFSTKGLFLEEQPSGDYVDDIPPSVVTKYVVDPKTGSFNLVVSRKSRYSSTQIEYTVSLTSRHFEAMMGCWRDVIKAGEPLSPRSTALKDDKNKKKNKNSPKGSPVFGEDDEGSPRRDRGRSSSGSVPINSRTVPRSTSMEQQPSPKKQELLIDL